ncbi:MAG TPA: transcription termination/antitermination factor NusG [Candidatus Dependentiae bacterium]|nr:transcription termination/antitermination factor NusG [Candidatus Dependentiae bacterium]
MKRWYVVQVYAGYEQKVKTDIQKRIQEEDLQNHFGEILIPSAKVKQLFVLEEQKDQQLFPGYVLIEVEMMPETIRLVTSALYVLRFLGGKVPEPLSKKEIDRIILQIKGEIEVGVEKKDFDVGAEVEIKEGPFTGFVGIVDKVDQESERLTVMVSILGRMTPVDLGFYQVKQ